MFDPKVDGMMRHVLGAVGAVLVYMGYLDEASSTEFVGGAMTILAFMWSWVSK